MSRLVLVQQADKISHALVSRSSRKQVVFAQTLANFLQRVAEGLFEQGMLILIHDHGRYDDTYGITRDPR